MMSQDQKIKEQDDAIVILINRNKVLQKHIDCLKEGNKKKEEIKNLTMKNKRIL